jgi:hypothetical protein
MDTVTSSLSTMATTSAKPMPPLVVTNNTGHFNGSIATPQVVIFEGGVLVVLIPICC